MLLLNPTSVLQLVVSANGAISCSVSWVDNLNGAITPGQVDGSSIVVAGTTNIVASPAANTQRNVNGLVLTNTGNVNNTLTPQRFDGTNTSPYPRATLLPGETFLLDELGTWTHYDSNGGAYAASQQFNIFKRVTANVVMATAATFADVTGLTADLKSGIPYNFEAHLYNANNAATTGSQFGVNIGAVPTKLLMADIGVVTTSPTAAALSAGSAVARDTAPSVQTTGCTTIHLEILSGYIVPSADGTLAIRATSEVSVAAGLTVVEGSWLRVWASQN